MGENNIPITTTIIPSKAEKITKGREATIYKTKAIIAIQAYLFLLLHHIINRYLHKLIMFQQTQEFFSAIKSPGPALDQSTRRGPNLKI